MEAPQRIWLTAMTKDKLMSVDQAVVLHREDQVATFGSWGWEVVGPYVLSPEATLSGR